VLKKKGLFVTFEGGDGSGKTTLIASLKIALEKKGYQVIRTRAPGGTILGEEIRSVLLSSSHVKMHPRAELFLFLADRAQHIEEIIKPALKERMIILCDRFNDSTIAYQGAARKLEKDYVKNLCTLACSGLSPDLTLYLDIDPALGLERVRLERKEKDRIEDEDICFHKAIRDAYRKIAHDEPSRFKMIDASLDKNTLVQEALGKICELL
jgi:dTMP kinase